jgi:hypothetical protein
MAHVFDTIVSCVRNSREMVFGLLPKLLAMERTEYLFDRSIEISNRSAADIFLNFITLYFTECPTTFGN